MDEVEETSKTYKLLDEAEDIIRTISEAFGPDDFKTQHATQVFQDMVVDPSYETVKIAVMYLRWCMLYPHRIGAQSEPRPDQTCGDCSKVVCHNGFILDDEDAFTWRPCHKLLPETHENWQKETGYLYPTRS